MNKINGKSLEECLELIDKHFGIDNMLNVPTDHKGIQKYFTDSSWAYSRFHSKEGAVHMSLNYDGKYNTSGYYTAPNEIGNIIHKKGVKNSLEIGCGKGFNSIYLAGKFPETQFLGQDITPKHLSIASKNSSHLKNVRFEYGDYHSIQLPEDSYDLVFAIESACYTRDVNSVLSGIQRVLKTGGSFMMYDAFRTTDFDQLSEILRIIGQLTEKTMAVQSFATSDDWIKIASKNNFELSENADISEAMMPNLIRLNRLAHRFFEKKSLVLIAKLFLPQSMLMNSVAGLLMPYVVDNKLHRYHRMIFEKR